jgi:hypothetical protein
MTELRRLAETVGLENILAPLDETWDRDLRNAVFHADYSIHGGETRIPALGKRYTHEEIQTLVNQSLACHAALDMLRRLYRGGYEEPSTIPIRWRRPVRGGPDGAFEIELDRARVIVRDGVGVIGLKHAHSREEVAAGAIAWHLANFYPDEIAAIRADPSMDHFPARPGG